MKDETFTLNEVTIRDYTDNRSTYFALKIIAMTVLFSLSLISHNIHVLNNDNRYERHGLEDSAPPPTPHVWRTGRVMTSTECNELFTLVYDDLSVTSIESY